MTKGKRAYPASVPVEPFFERQMKDPAFREAYEALEPEYEIIRQIIDLRLKRKMSQAELAKRIGTKQPSIARMERRGKTRDLDYLQRVANALDARLEVRLVPREAKGSRGDSRRAKRT